MQKHIKILFTMVLAFAIILSMATGVLATEQEHVHNWQCAWSDNYWHSMVCSGCNEEKTTTHRNNSEGICKVCGHTPHEHDWQYTQGENYDYNHGLHCTQCAATSSEDHIYGNDGKCTVCGNAPPHEHQWKWDGNKSNYLWDHFLVCSCGATTTEPHLLTWDGKTRDEKFHTMVCVICGYSMGYGHSLNSTSIEGEKCSICGYPAQGAAEPEKNPNKTTPVNKQPAENQPKETESSETKPAETEQKETAPIEMQSAETQAKETESAENESTQSRPTSSETMPKNAAKEDSQRSSSVGIWVATILVVVGGLGTVVFFVKKKSS